MQKCGDTTLMRFLIARSMDPEKAAKMFVQWQKWRTSLVPNGFITDSEVPEELAAKKIYLQGLSTKGYPVMIIKGCKHFPSKDQLQFKSNSLCIYNMLYIYIYVHIYNYVLLNNLITVIFLRISLLCIYCFAGFPSWFCSSRCFDAFGYKSLSK